MAKSCTNCKAYVGCILYSDRKANEDRASVCTWYKTVETPAPMFQTVVPVNHNIPLQEAYETGLIKQGDYVLLLIGGGLFIIQKFRAIKSEAQPGAYYFNIYTDKDDVHGLLHGDNRMSLFEYNVENRYITTINP